MATSLEVVEAGKGVVVMMRYPACMGALGKDELHELFCAIRRNQIMLDMDCTFGASITESPILPLPASTSAYVSSLVSKYESLTRHCSVPSDSHSASSGNPGEITNGFYCLSSPACTVTVGSDRVSAQFNSAIVVEVFTRGIGKDLVKDVCDCIAKLIHKNILHKRSLDLSIHFLISPSSSIRTYQPSNSGL